MSEITGYHIEHVSNVPLSLIYIYRSRFGTDCLYTNQPFRDEFLLTKC